ncbi:MAG: hypothetical protein B7Z66_08185 [Chromatiales bacterium 21-64-14]|nr:MAG: hypothetical protein B7Z66_08185 [Chromatiales bacterium 21-64-14]HQU15315.1 hypothetical protein [Gammaproteobacteria bacterium]
MRFTVLVACLLVPFAAVAQGSQGEGAGTWNGGVAFSVAQFHYDEFVNNAVLDRETGALPGFVTTLGYTRGRWQAEGRLGYRRGTVDYYGQTQAGAAVQSRTDAAILDFSVRGGYRLPALGRWRSSVYGGLGYRRWERDIHSTPQAFGVAETYRWGYGFVGGTVGLPLDARTTVILDGRVTRSFAAQLGVDFGGVFDGQTLGVEDRFAGRLGLRFDYRLPNGWAVAAGPYVEWWNLGQGASQPLRQGGAQVGSVFEPRSATRVIGFEVGLRHAL